MLRALPNTPSGRLILVMINPNADDPYAVTEQAIIDVLAQYEPEEPTEEETV